MTMNVPWAITTRISDEVSERMCQSDTAVKSSQNRGYEIAVHSEWRMVLKPGARPAKIPDDIAMRWSCQVSKVPALGTKSGRP